MHYVCYSNWKSEMNVTKKSINEIRKVLQYLRINSKL